MEGVAFEFAGSLHSQEWRILMPRGPRKQMFDTPVEKHDNSKVLMQQRTDARIEVGRIMTWAQHNRPGVDTDELNRRLVYLRDKVLREDV